MLKRLQVSLKGIAKALEDVNNPERVEHCSNDPVACAMYSKQVFDMILNISMAKRLSLFELYVVVLSKRVEFQPAGSPHILVLLWLIDAPEEELSSDKRGIIETINTLATLDTGLLKRERIRVHTRACYKRVRTNCHLCLMQKPRSSFLTKDRGEKSR